MHTDRNAARGKIRQLKMGVSGEVLYCEPRMDGKKLRKHPGQVDKKQNPGEEEKQAESCIAQRQEKQGWP